MRARSGWARETAAASTASDAGRAVDYGQHLSRSAASSVSRLAVRVEETVLDNKDVRAGTSASSESFT
jgi:hypothetical protein